MTVLVAGGTGFLGSMIVRSLSGEGQSVVVLTRNVDKAGPLLGEGIEAVRWDGRTTDGWRHWIDRIDGVVNLAGALIGSRRWTAAEKHLILASRIEPTRAIVRAIAAASHKPPVLINASAVGYYGPMEDEVAAEGRVGGTGFLAEVCRTWEETAMEATRQGVRVVMLRSGIVLGKEGGALPKMMIPFKLFAGGPIGSGKQWVPWIHPLDLAGSVRFALVNPSLRGAVNVVAPQNVSMREFCTTLGQVLHRPSWLRIPAPALRLALGEMADVVLTGQRAIPQALENAGFHFRFPTLRGALEDLLP